MKKVLLLLLAVVLTAVTLTSCTKEEKSGGTTSCTVVFDPNGGKIDGNDYFIATVTPGEKVAKPNDPVLEGGTFLGWFTADSAEWNFDTTVSTDMTLYAHWYIPDPRTVYFLANGGEFETGSKDTLIRVVMFNTAVSKPYVMPVREGYSFTGWFTADSTEWNFNTLITQDTTLYAGWKSDTCTVFFVANGGKIGGVDTLAVKVRIDSTVARPLNPAAGDSIFLGWYYVKNDNDTVQWDFSKPVTQDTTIFAKWQSTELGDVDRMMIIKYGERATGMEEVYVFKYKLSDSKLSEITVNDTVYALEYKMKGKELKDVDSVNIMKSDILMGSIKDLEKKDLNKAKIFNVWSKRATFNLDYLKDKDNKPNHNPEKDKYLKSLQYVGGGETYYMVKDVKVHMQVDKKYCYDSLRTEIIPGAKIEFDYGSYASEMENKYSSHVFSPSFFVYAFLKNVWKTQNSEEDALAMAVFNTDFFERYDYYIPETVNVTLNGSTLPLKVEYKGGTKTSNGTYTSIDINLPEAFPYSKASFYEITE